MVYVFVVLVNGMWFCREEKLRYLNEGARAVVNEERTDSKILGDVFGSLAVSFWFFSGIWVLWFYGLKCENLTSMQGM